MKKIINSERAALFTVMFCSIILVSCSNSNSISPNNTDDNKTFQTYIDVDPNSETRTDLEKELFKEATDRFSSKMIVNEDGTMTLIEGTTADDLQISPELFELFNNVLDIYNEKPTPIPYSNQQ